jgi:hypothetical protein
MFSAFFFFPKLYPLWGNVEKCGVASETTDDSKLYYGPKVMWFSCRITNERIQTDTTYVLRTALPRRHTLHESVSVLRETYIAGLVFVCSEYGYEEKSQAVGMRLDLAQLRSLFTTLQSERKLVRRLHLRISCPAVQPDGLEEQPPEYKSVALPSESAYSVTHMYFVCTHIYVYAYIHTRTQTDTLACMHTYIVHTYHTYEGSS